MDTKFAGAGIQFPVTPDGHRSTMATGKAVLSAAVRELDPGLAEAIQTEPNWHKHYGRYLVDMVRLTVQSADTAVSIANKGLTSVHQSFRFIRDGDEMAVQEAMNRFRKPRLYTGTIQGRGERLRCLQIPYRDGLLSGDSLRHQIDTWELNGVMETSAAEALQCLVDRDDWLDLRDLHFVLLGAAAEIGPVELLSRLGANIVAVDLDRPAVWEKLLSIAREGAGRMRFPLREPQSEDTSDESLAAIAGSDLLTAAPEIRTWLADQDQAFCIGGYAYMHGQSHVLVEVAMDAIIEDLAAQRRDIALAFLLSPTDVFLIPDEVAQAAREDFVRAGMSRLWRGPLRALTRGRLYAPNAEFDISDVHGNHYGLYDGIVPAQGPNYALAKHMQKWRALAARAGGYRVSANVAPSTVTASVLTRRDFAAAYAGAKQYGVEIFEPATTNAIMAALLIHDLRNDGCPTSPAVAIPHPLALFMNEAVHGGLWRTGLQLRSVIEIAAIRGLISRQRRQLC
jgi:hypothetical protein